MITKLFTSLPISQLVPYENNPRINDDAVADVMESIKQTGNLDPIEVDEDYVILQGHTRLKALKKLGYTETEVVIYQGLTEEQKIKYLLLGNKTAERAEWDEQKLLEELEKVDFEGYDFGFDFAQELEEEQNPYSPNVKIPQYEVTGAKPLLAELCDHAKTDAMIAKIEEADVSPEEKEFLKLAATRHIAFNYRNVAEYYANATPEMQRLMEESALVIIDLDDAMANGYAKLQAEIEEMAEGDGDE